MHVHVKCADGEAKFWLEPTVSIAVETGLSKHTLRKIQDIIKEHENEIRSAWEKHFQG